MGKKLNEARKRIRELEAALAEDPADADAAAALWNTASRADVPSRAAPTVITAVEAAARRGDSGLPAQLWADLLRTAPGADIDLRTATRVAELLMKEGLEGDVELTLLWLAGRVDSSTPDGLLARLARMAHHLTLPAPFVALALEKKDLSPELRRELQSLSGFSA